MDTETVATVVSTMVAVAGLFGGWMKFRESTLRRGDVLTWSDDVISALQSLLLVCILKESQLDAEASKTKIVEIIFETSILVERGRMFFRNKIIDDYGEGKESSYRGYRPKILDPIIVAHQIACRWNEADTETKLRMKLLAEDSRKKVVSMAQKEVGRNKTASADPGAGGDGVHLSKLLGAVDQKRLELLKKAE